jgi:coenzyme PQQ precursor peptide PqqA
MPALTVYRVANALIRITLMVKGEFFRPVSKKGRAQMAWKAPKIVEVPVGMEINMYMCATRK